MRAEQIDPRDQTLQIDAPSYRVYFWTEDGAKEEWELSGMDLYEVLEWIRSTAGGRSYSLWVATQSPGNVCLIRLQGIDLDAEADSWPAGAGMTY
jgi:hypothetical protein